MTIDTACVECIINQSSRVADILDVDEATRKKLLDMVTKRSKNFSFSLTPPEIASGVYKNMADILQKDDIYDEVKEESTKKALMFVPLLQQKKQNSKDKLLAATKIAIAGNVIDLAAEVEFDLQKEIENIFDIDFDYAEFEKMKNALTQAKSLLLVADNTGEHIFDYLFVQTIKELYPEIKIYYMVRGCAIINDVTIKEAKKAGFEEYCTVVDSGVDTPGFVYARANAYSQDLFDSSDLVICKGMGNYECLSPPVRTNLVYLLKVKCGVVAASLGKGLGDIVCKMV